jgi:hypothetical protein
MPSISVLTSASCHGPSGLGRRYLSTLAEQPRVPEKQSGCSTPEHRDPNLLTSARQRSRQSTGIPTSSPALGSGRASNPRPDPSSSVQLRPAPSRPVQLRSAPSRSVHLRGQEKNIDARKHTCVDHVQLRPTPYNSPRLQSEATVRGYSPVRGWRGTHTFCGVRLHTPAVAVPARAGVRL